MSKTLAEWRAQRRITQVELAVAAGVSVSTIVNVETSRQDVTISTARKIAHALGISLDDIAWPDEGSLQKKRSREHLYVQLEMMSDQKLKRLQGRVLNREHEGNDNSPKE